MNVVRFLRNAPDKNQSIKGYEGETRVRFCDFFHKASLSVGILGEGSMFIMSWCWAGLLWILL